MMYTFIYELLLSRGYLQQHVPFLDSVVVGGKVDEYFMTQMSEQNKTNYFDGTLKRGDTEVVDSSSNDELITNHLKKSKVAFQLQSIHTHI